MLTNMKMEPKESQDQYGMSAVSDSPAYPYGLEIRLDSESIKKLDLKSLPQVGSNLMVTARVEVTSVSSNDSKEGGKNHCVSLQITDMELGAEKEESSTAKDLYGEGA
jgi:hypothetical protein